MTGQPIKSSIKLQEWKFEEREKERERERERGKKN
jgi:hypothetical protein